ncbi:hypothetical protein PENTCL1PPCAC_29871 [Pristionchus entomophagus]|uniref:G protein-coupled receptor n=1 Tax=Pristionchus entomophagus TaxID=358040 RepID=A0AAV5UM82_9BILA|nr:hypothetical protein PENTCL1PPCAC_29871 [Pristionchus entomophagus]
MRHSFIPSLLAAVHHERAQTLPLSSLSRALLDDLTFFVLFRRFQYFLLFSWRLMIFPIENFHLDAPDSHFVILAIF